MPSPDPNQNERLADEVSELRDEVRVLRNALDEFREEFTWAVRNGRVTYHAIDSPLEELAPPSPEPTENQAETAKEVPAPQNYGRLF